MLRFFARVFGSASVDRTYQSCEGVPAHAPNFRAYAAGYGGRGLL